MARLLQLVWGVNALLVSEMDTSSSTFSKAMAVAQEQELLAQGDLVVQTCGTLAGVSGSTDLLKVGLVGSDGSAPAIL